MSASMIQTKHPHGKANKPVAADKYDVVKDALLKALCQEKLTHTDLVTQVTQLLNGKFDGNISWHVMTVKLDLEAGKIIRRNPGRPVKYSII